VKEPLLPFFRRTDRDLHYKPLQGRPPPPFAVPPTGRGFAAAGAFLGGEQRFWGREVFFPVGVVACGTQRGGTEGVAKSQWKCGYRGALFHHVRQQFFSINNVGARRPREGDDNGHPSSEGRAIRSYGGGKAIQGGADVSRLLSRGGVLRSEWAPGARAERADLIREGPEPSADVSRSAIWSEAGADHSERLSLL
jgi:hypothetical protein